MTEPSRRWSRDVLKSRFGPKPGEVAVNAHCRKCSRYWFKLVGSAEGQLRTVTDYVEVYLDDSTAKPFKLSRFDIRTGNPNAASQVRVIPNVGPVEGERTVGATRLPKYRYQRWLVTCHRRCGRQIPLTWMTLEGEFADALAHKHAAVTF